VNQVRQGILAERIGPVCCARRTSNPGYGSL